MSAPCSKIYHFQSRSTAFKAIGYTPEKEDRANRLLLMEIQLGWLKDIGFVEVDCYWKWLEMALLIGYKA
jgi:tRNA (cmo5U34)-methyltransferase